MVGRKGGGEGGVGSVVGRLPLRHSKQEWEACGVTLILELVVSVQWLKKLSQCLHILQRSDYYETTA